VADSGFNMVRMEDDQDQNPYDLQIRDRHADWHVNFFWTTEVDGQHSFELLDLEMESLQNE